MGYLLLTQILEGKLIGYLLNFYGIETFVAVNHFELYPVFFPDSETVQAGNMNENISAGTIFNNKPVPFTLVEKLDFTRLHTT